MCVTFLFFCARKIRNLKAELSTIRLRLGSTFGAIFLSRYYLYYIIPYIPTIIRSEKSNKSRSTLRGDERTKYGDGRAGARGEEKSVSLNFYRFIPRKKVSSFWSVDLV